MAMSYLFVADIKCSELEAIRSGAVLAIARPQPPPPEGAQEQSPESACWPCSVWLAFLPSLFWGLCSLRVRPLPHCAAESAYLSEFDMLLRASPFTGSCLPHVEVDGTLSMVL